MSEPESSDGHQPESITEPVAEPEPTAEPVAEPEPTPEPAAEPETVAEPKTETDGNSHLFAVRTTGGQEKIVMRLLEARIKMGKINIQSVVLLSDLKGYVVVEAQDVSAMFDAIQGIRHVRGLLDATYQLPVTVDANYLKLVPA